MSEPSGKATEVLRQAQRKLEKIQRALKKAEDEGNKVNAKKCRKFMLKYKAKIDKLKRKSKQTTPSSGSSSSSESESGSGSESDTDSDSSSSSDSSSGSTSRKNDRGEKHLPVKQSQQSVEAKQQPIKLPYPVINDKRDLNTILATLDSKSIEILKKREQNQMMLDKAIREGGPAMRIEKLRQLDQAYDSQQDKLNKQIDYVKLSLNLEALRANVHLMMANGPLIEKLSLQLTEMHNYMKNENAKKIKEAKQMFEHRADIEASAQSPKSSANKTTLTQTEKLGTLLGIVNNSLATLLAHTAASAHSTAAITAYTYSYYNYVNASEGEGSKKSALPPPIVPIRTEIEKASSTFAKYKDKISSFFQTNTQKEEKKAKSVEVEVKGFAALKDLMAAYSDNLKGEKDESSDSSSDEDEEIAKKRLKTEENKKEETKQVEKEAETSDDEEDDENELFYTDLDKDCDLEIVMTSELKSEEPNKRNYLLPSLKACYLPLKASLTAITLTTPQANLEESIVSEKSRHGLTFMGPSYSSARNRKLSDILYS